MSESEDRNEAVAKDKAKARKPFGKGKRLGEETVGDLMGRAIHESLFFIGVFAVVAIVVGYMFVGWPGIWSAVIATLTTVMFCLSNPLLVAVLSRLHLRPAAYLTWFLLGWLIKVGICFVVLLAIQRQTWLDAKLCAIFIAVGAGIILLAEMHTAATSRVPYVDPPTRRKDDSGFDD
ncbi:hypothetical protein [Bifidobacterium simiarum]|uniref:Uncharacterized protein n=1 Tax=Bifidobacterium simiarum TaxID=2045441 RepID=A0A2M9HCX9_9BIFI|nr:hypothetical protein [Bifidobacterium simiarum]PJM74661.1 hypothetical protein CSQ87_08980 [Bifidobacterium simiarum]